MQGKNTKNMEVEIRARVDNLDVLEDTLKVRGAKFVESTYLCDVYFCDQQATRFEDVEMNEVGSYSLRLRKEKKDDDKEHITLNTKTITNHGDHNAWEEHEVEVNDFVEAVHVLNATEFKPFFKLEKTRRLYRSDDMSIYVEDIVDFGGAIEIEIMSASGDETSAKETIKDFLKQCNIDNNQIVPKSITNIIMRERAFKQKIEF